MARPYPDLLITGYADDIEAACAELAAYPGKVHRADEWTVGDAPDAWRGAIVGYVFSRDAGASSQLKSLFTYFHHHLNASHELVILREAQGRIWIFPELESLPRRSVGVVREYLETLLGRI